MQAPREIAGNHIVAKTYIDTVVEIDRRYTLGLSSRSHRMVGHGAAHMQFSHDPSHGLDHLLRMAQDTGTMLALEPRSFRRRIDWNVYWPSQSWHDVGVSRMRPSPWSLVVGQFFESFIAHGPARDYMRRNQFPRGERTEIERTIMLHPYSPFHRVRLRYQHSELKKTTPTELLLTDMDSLDVLHPQRIYRMYELVRQALGYESLHLALPIFKWMYRGLTRFEFHFDWTKQEAQGRRDLVLAYVDQLA